MIYRNRRVFLNFASLTIETIDDVNKKVVIFAQRVQNCIKFE